MLHISKEEQAERLQERIDDPDKHWKFNPADLDDRKLWDDYMAAYETAVSAARPRMRPGMSFPPTATGCAMPRLRASCARRWRR